MAAEDRQASETHPASLSVGRTPPDSWARSRASRASSSSSFDPYRQDSIMPTANTYASQNHGAYQQIPLYTSEDQNLLSPTPTRPYFGPRLMQKQSKRTGKVPEALSTSTSRSDVSKDDIELYNPYDRPKPISSASDNYLLSTPSFPTDFPSPSRPRRHPIPFASKGFEAPEWKRIIIHVTLCAIAYPFLLLVALVAKEKSIFWCRTIVGIGCGVAGVTLGLSLVELAKAFLEAATWATLIHQSNVPFDAPGIRLRDLTITVENGTTIWGALRLMWARWYYSGTARINRKSYDKRPWSLFVIFVLIATALASLLSFILARFVDINTSIVHGRYDYEEVSVKGDLSADDISRAAVLSDTFNGVNGYALTWTISPFSALGNLPPSLILPWQDDQVYLSEVASSQLRAGGSGFGTFAQNATGASTDLVDQDEFTDTSETKPGTLLRFPRWGIRIHCKKVSNGVNNIIPRSPGTFTWAFVPRQDVRDLFNSFNLPVDPIVEKPFNKTVFFANEPTFVPPNVNLDDMLDISSAMFYDNGVAHSFKSFPVSMGADGLGWVSLETLLVRLNDAFTPNGVFQVKSPSTIVTELMVGGVTTNVTSRYGYDAAICLELFEPYIVEVYNSSVGLPATTKIVSKGGHIAGDMANGVPLTVLKGQEITDRGVTRELNSSNLARVYETLHGNSVNQILKDNGRDAKYVPSPTIVSYTGGSGPLEYTELSAEFFAKAKAKADSMNILPYLAGSGDTVAWAFNDSILANARVNNLYVPIVLGSVLLMGLIAGFFVPKLPMGVPRRGFDLYSWLAALQGHELVGDRPPLQRKHLHLDDLEHEFGDTKFRYSGLT